MFKFSKIGISILTRSSYLNKLFYSLFCLVGFVYSNTDVLAVKVDSIRTSTPISSPVLELQRDIASLIDNPEFYNAFIGVSIVSMETGETVFKKNDTRNFNPASTQKLMTSAAALEYLGKDFRFTTKVYLDGTLQPNGEFIGNIIVRGAGDPSISNSFYENPLEIFDNWAKVLDSIGLKSIRGNIIGDDSYFEGDYYPPGWMWDDMIYPFSAQVNGLSIFDNKIDLNIEPGDSIGASAKIKIFPENNYVSFINKLRTIQDSEFETIYPQKEPKTNIVELIGGIKLNSKKKGPKSISVTIDNPTLFFLNLFKSSLDKKNIKFRGALVDIDDWNQKITYADKTPVCELLSPPLYELLKEVNKKSNNLWAESIFKTIAKENTGHGSFSFGADQIMKFASKIGISSERIAVVDGSGLSRLDLTTPAFQTTLLSYVYRSANKNEFINSLAKPGEDGTLKNRMKKSRAETSVNAKTGSMNAVCALTGYVKTKDNETLAFSIMVTNFTSQLSSITNLQDLICMRLASFSRKRR